MKPIATVSRVDRGGNVATLLVVELPSVGYLALLLNVAIQDPDELRVRLFVVREFAPVAINLGLEHRGKGHLLKQDDSHLLARNAEVKVDDGLLPVVAKLFDLVVTAPMNLQEIHDVAN